MECRFKRIKDARTYKHQDYTALRQDFGYEDKRRHDVVEKEISSYLILVINLSQSSTRILSLLFIKKSQDMSGETNGLLVPDEMVMNKIFYVRNLKVMLDMDLAI